MSIILIIGCVLAIATLLFQAVRHIHRLRRMKRICGGKFAGSHGRQIHINDHKCARCRACVRKCTQQVFDMVKDDKGLRVVVKNPDNCTRCGDCFDVCKFGALSLKLK